MPSTSAAKQETSWRIISPGAAREPGYVNTGPIAGTELNEQPFPQAAAENPDPGRAVAGRVFRRLAGRFSLDLHQAFQGVDFIGPGVGKVGLIQPEIAHAQLQPLEQAVKFLEFIGLDEVHGYLHLWLAPAHP